MVWKIGGTFFVWSIRVQYILLGWFWYGTNCIIIWWILSVYYWEGQVLSLVHVRAVPGSALYVSLYGSVTELVHPCQATTPLTQYSLTRAVTVPGTRYFVRYQVLPS